MSLEELNATVGSETNKINALVSSYRREEPHGIYKIQWGLTRGYDAFDYAVGDGGGPENFIPLLFAAADQGRLLLQKMPGAVISRFGEIKTALELWIAGNGPWPEPKEETVD